VDDACSNQKRPEFPIVLPSQLLAPTDRRHTEPSDRCPPADLARRVSRTQMDQSELLGGCSSVPEFVLRRLSATPSATKQGGAESMKARIVGEASIDKDHRTLAAPYVHPDEGEREAEVLPALHGGGDEDSRHPSEELDRLVTR
jgi:hypothetical protein